MKLKIVILVASSCILSACASSYSGKSTIKKAELKNEQTFLLTEIAENPNYGYKKKNPIQVGGVKHSEGPLNERRFLNALAGPNGEKVSYFRAGSCCSFNSKNGFMGKGMLDIYRVYYEGSKDTVSLYLNMYDRNVLKAPKGFTIY